MNRCAFRRIIGAVCILSAVLLWHNFIVGYLNNDSFVVHASSPRVYVLTTWFGTRRYAVSAGLPFVAFLLLCLLPDTLKELFSNYKVWMKWYWSVAAVLLTLQVLSMLCVTDLYQRLGLFSATTLSKLTNLGQEFYFSSTRIAAILILAVSLVRILCRCFRAGPGSIRPKAISGVKTLFWCLLIAFVWTMAALLLLNVASDLYSTNSGIIKSDCMHNARNTLEAYVSLLVAPVVEEIAYRGLICRGINRALGKWPAILISAVLFGLWHRNVPQMVYTIPWGIIWGYVFLETGTVKWSVLMHFASNLLAILSFSYNKTDVLGAWPLFTGIQAWLWDLSTWASVLLIVLIIGIVVFGLHRIKKLQKLVVPKASRLLK